MISSIRLFLTMLMSATVIRSLSTKTSSARNSVHLASSVSALLQNPSLLSSLTTTPANKDDNNCNHHDEKQHNTFAVYNPANPQQVIANVPIMGRTCAHEAMARAATALPAWRDCTTASFRASILQAWSRAILDNANDLAIIMTLESGKPLAEALGEVSYAASFLDYYAAEAIRPTSAGGGFIVPSPFTQQQQQQGAPRGQVMAIQQAVGVCAMITTWNFPAAMITRKVGPALAVGCTAVVKPSELTPLTALALQQLAKEAGLPDGCLEMVTSNRKEAAAVGEAFCRAEQVRKLSFTGSTAVGKVLMEQCSSTVKRLSLELGGNAPFVVFEDANLDRAVTAAVASKFRNAGQTCVCADRFLIHESIHDEFVDKFCRAVEALKMGPGLEASTNFGPLINQAAVDSVDAKVKEAIQEGAICRTCTGGGKASLLSNNNNKEMIMAGGGGGGNFYAPTILTNVSLTSRIWVTETFGPVAAIRSFATEEEALAIANDSPVGLAGYFCTQDMSRAFRFGKQLECGLVGVNEGVISTCVAPFGGVKESGVGREGSAMGISEYLETKYLLINA